MLFSTSTKKNQLQFINSKKKSIKLIKKSEKYSNPFQNLNNSLLISHSKIIKKILVLKVHNLSFTNIIQIFFCSITTWPELHDKVNNMNNCYFKPIKKISPRKPLYRIPLTEYKLFYKFCKILITATKTKVKRK